MSLAMSLAMSRPWIHPKSGVFWLRKGVPEDLRALVGKREESRSLQTRDPSRPSVDMPKASLKSRNVGPIYARAQRRLPNERPISWLRSFMTGGCGSR